MSMLLWELKQGGVSTLGPLLRQIGKVATLLAVTLTVVALILSVYQAQISRNQLELTKEIALSVSTKFLDQFPHNIPHIKDLAYTTCGRLLIASDYVGYGQFSHKEYFIKYIEALETLGVNQDIEVIMYVYDRPTMLKALEGQFADGDFSEFARSEKFRKYYRTRKLIPTNKEEFFEDLMKIEFENRQRLKNNGVVIKEIHDVLPVFVWMSDKREAIFTFHAFGKSPREVAFTTKDGRLMDILERVIEKETGEQVSEQLIHPALTRDSDQSVIVDASTVGK